NLITAQLLRSKKRDYITPILASLHWLPVHFRINFKILLVVINLFMVSPLHISQNFSPLTAPPDLSDPPTVACWLCPINGKKKKGRGQSFFCSGSRALE
ncbi:hypothetical protein LDENG_00208740, partial [Lucifuga dentata]